MFGGIIAQIIFIYVIVEKKVFLSIFIGHSYILILASIRMFFLKIRYHMVYFHIKKNKAAIIPKKKILLTYNKGFLLIYNIFSKAVSSQ